MVESLLSLAMVGSFVIYGNVLHLFGRTEPKLKSNLAKLTYKDKDECIAKNELEIIAAKYVAAVEKQFLAYIKVENEIITREAMEKNLIFANNVYGTRTLVGINSTHKINPPAPIIKAEDFLLKK